MANEYRAVRIPGSEWYQVTRNGTPVTKAMRKPAAEKAAMDKAFNSVGNTGEAAYILIPSKGAYKITVAEYSPDRGWSDVP